MEIACSNTVCWGTGFQQVSLLPASERGRSSAAVAADFALTWIKPFGFPEVAVSDLVPEYM
eukprot:13551505-Alexandrium_andersonii.AAC.1